MTKIIPTKFGNTKCRGCAATIPYGANVQWTKGAKGVLCMQCATASAPAAPVATPAAPVSTTEVAAYIVQLTGETMAQREQIALLSDALTLANSALEAARTALRAQQTKIARLRAANAMLAPATEQPEILAALVGDDTSAQDIVTADPVMDPADLIDVLAPGGVEAWLAHDLAQIATEKAMRNAEQADLDATNYGYDDTDCPI